MRERWNLGWLFHYGDEPGADFMGWDDAAWERVTLPHDWAVSFPFDRKNASGTGYLPGGTAWYRKHFVLTAEEAAQTTEILFEGIYKNLCQQSLPWTACLRLYELFRRCDAVHPGG